MRKATATFILILWAGVVVHGQEKHFQNVMSSGDAAFSLDLSKVADLNGASITIRNNSSSSVAMPWVSAAGTMPPLNKQSIITFLKNSTSSDEDLAIASWQYVMNYSIGYCAAGSSYDPAGYAANPMRMLYGYGMGCCDQQAVILAWLWDAAGYKTQIAIMTFHSVPEIFYGGAWHMLDPNHRVIYRMADNSIANVDQILADPLLVANTHDSNGLDPVGWFATTMAQLYAANASSLHYVRLGYSAPADPAFILFPHESMELRSENPRPDPIYRTISSDQTPLAASRFASVLFNRPLGYTASGWSSQAQSIQALATQTTQSGRSILTSVGGNTGQVVYSQSWPFPIQSLSIHGDFLVNDPSASVVAYFSADGTSWSQPVPFLLSPQSGDVSSKVDLSQLARGAYSYFVKLQFSGTSTAAVGAYSIGIDSQVQMGPQLFPQLQPGQINSLEYRDLAPASQARSTEITLAVPQGASEIPRRSAESLVPESPNYSLALGYQSSKLIDADTTSLAYPGSTSVDYVIHLGDTFHVAGISLWWGVFGTNPIYVNNWNLYGRSDPSQPWALLTTGGFPNSVLSDVAVDTFATDLRVTATSNNWIGLYEFKAYGNEIKFQQTGLNRTAISNVREDPFYSIAQNYGAANLVDGSSATLAYPASTSVDYVIGLGGRSHVNNLAINWGVFGSNPIYVGNWSVLARDGTGEWLKVANGGSPGSASTQFSTDIHATDLRLTASSGANWIGVYELGISSGMPILPVVFSSNVSDAGPYAHPTSALMDGDETSLAYPGSPYIDYQLDFGSDTYLDLVDIVWGYFGTSPIYVGKWEIYGQREGETDWAPLTGGGYPNGTRSTATIMRTYRKIRVTATSLQGNWIGIYEVEPFGTK